MSRRNLTKELEQRTLLLDGALGTQFQQHNLTEEDFRGAEFANWHKELRGCNDILCLTKPDVVASVTQKYIDAGADIITTNSFNATSISLADYGLEDQAYRISKAAAQIARTEADRGEEKGQIRFVAGSVGPTSRTASMSADVENPAHRDVTFDGLVEAYSAQINGLLDGGADLILLETIFDTLNAKAALYAINKIGAERGEEIQIMASGTITDASGRTLSGQMIDAFYYSLSHANLISIGVNCAFGAKQMLPYVERLSSISEIYVSAHPNAGLPNVMGGYDETPEMFLADAEEYLARGVVNIIGGCCGTTPEHIKLLRGAIDKYPPRKLKSTTPTTTLTGLETLRINSQSNFINIGERGNVAGSAKFARLIREGAFEEALSVVRAQVSAGAQIIDICMDDGMIDGVEAMHNFLCLIASEPEISRVPLMIDSSNWNVILAGLKVTQGKSIVNSISLKEGEESFIQKAMEIHRFGAAAVVMLFDERGQADTYERKVEIAQRAYKILTENGFPAEDIIFDPNVLSVATGIEAHDSYAKAFIDATEWIKQNLPHAKVSGGVSNLSFSFRGNNTVREAMHSAFLYHAIKVGMDMAIVNPQMIQIYDQIDPELLELIEDVILCRRGDGAERLTEYAQRIKGSATSSKDQVNQNEWRTLPLDQRVQHAMIKGIGDFIEVDTMEGYEQLASPMKVIDKLLMPAMEQVGKLFGEGKMFLPQVVKTARVMKQAVGVLTPYINQAAVSDANHDNEPKIVIATVKGDVHDIGKNIVSVVMACNGYKIIDLGVMVENSTIVDEAVANNATAICLSGLITPSLEEMIQVAKECERRGLLIPIILGGATTSQLHTAVKIAPHYSGVVIHANNASENPKILSQLLGAERESYIASIKADQQQKLQEYERTLKTRNLLSLADVRLNSKKASTDEVIKPLHTGRVVFSLSSQQELNEVKELIDWNFFFMSWGLKGQYPAILDDAKYGEEATKLFADAQVMLSDIIENKRLTLQGVVAILPAISQEDDIIVKTPKKESIKLPMLRNQTPMQNNISLADYIAPKDDYIGCFALTAGVGLDKLTDEYKTQGDDYKAMIAKLIADRLAEAFAQWAHRFMRREMWGYESDEEMSTRDIIRDKYQGVRMAFGYPACPDHSLKREVFKLLNVEMTTQMRLTDNFMITPAESLCGLIFPRGEYFGVGIIDDEQLTGYAQRRGVSIDEVKRVIPNNI
ncbi:MAG: methionine synthase [Rikenellaceae bacterium]